MVMKGYVNELCELNELSELNEPNSETFPSTKYFIFVAYNSIIIWELSISRISRISRRLKTLIHLY